MHNILYRGLFKDHIKNYIELKKAIGYKYDTEAHHLRRFDQFTVEKYPEVSCLTKEMVLEWCSKRAYEAQATQNSRASVIREFGKYLDSIGIKTYIVPKGYYPSEPQYMPHIYTLDELAKLFAETDKCRYSCECPYRHQIMPVIFRMIYMCGLRVSEARLLKVGDVVLEKGILTINHSKKDNSRLVVMSDALTERCRGYSKQVSSDPRRLLLPSAW